jgi:hypothetical protein
MTTDSRRDSRWRAEDRVRNATAAGIFLGAVLGLFLGGLLAIVLGSSDVPVILIAMLFGAASCGVVGGMAGGVSQVERAGQRPDAAPGDGAPPL